MDDYTLAIIGAGSAAEQLMRRLEGSDERIVVFEPEFVGGECPFLACMPSKAMLHDRTTGRSWDDAVDRRQDITSHLDDTGHADDARDLGATIVRSRARITAPGRVEADGIEYTVDNIVVATGAAPIVPDIDGLDGDHPRVWTSRDALTATDRPASVAIVGGGVIGSELAFMFAGYGSQVVTLDTADRPADDLHPRVSELIVETLQRAGVNVVNGVAPDRVELGDDGVVVHLEGGDSHRADVLIVATGRRPQTSDVGLETLGVNPEELEVGDAGQVIGADGVWIAGDAAGLAQYTHVANHHADVIADHLVGGGERRYDDAVVPACIFLDPPVMVVGPSWSELQDDDDVVWAEIDVETARHTTDEHRTGFLALGARRSTGCLVAASGIGARFDEIIHAVVVAIDGQVPVEVLARTIQPFPTVGETLGVAYADLLDQLA